MAGRLGRYARDRQAKRYSELLAYRNLRCRQVVLCGAGPIQDAIEITVASTKALTAA